MDLELITPPVSEPVTVAEVKSHLRITLDDEDTDIEAYAKAARQAFEKFSRRQLNSATYKLHLDQWEPEIVIPIYPVTSISSITYKDSNGTDQSFTDYEVNVKSTPAVIYIKSYPSLHQYKAPKISITFVAGGGTIDPLILQAIKLQAASWYRNRENDTDQEYHQLPVGFRDIINQYRIWRY